MGLAILRNVEAQFYFQSKHGYVSKGPDRIVHQMLTLPATINPERKPAVGSRPGSVLTFQDLHLTSTLLG